MEQEMSNKRNTEKSELYKDTELIEVLDEIEEIKEKIEQFNTKMNNSI